MLLSPEVNSRGSQMDDLERRNSPNRRVISPNSVAFGADYVLVEGTPLFCSGNVGRIESSF